MGQIVKKHIYLFMSLLLLIAVFSPVPSFSASTQVSNIEIPFVGRLRYEGQKVDEIVDMMVAIVNVQGQILWTSDGTQGGLPTASFEVDVQEGSFFIGIGGEQMTTLPASIFYGSQKLYVILWINGEQFVQWIPLPTVPRAAVAFDAMSLGSIDASEYVLKDDLDDLSGTFTTDTLEFGSDNTSSDKKIVANVEGSADPYIEFDGDTWKLSDDGENSYIIATQNDYMTADRFVGTGSTSQAVDLDTAEVLGILPVNKGGTGASTAAGARSNLGLVIGQNVQAYNSNILTIKNNLNASANPVSTDDANAGYSVGSVWVNNSTDEAYVALDVTNSAAVWKSQTSVSTSSIADGSITNAKMAADSVGTSNIINGSVTTAKIRSNPPPKSTFFCASSLKEPSGCF